MTDLPSVRTNTPGVVAGQSGDIPLVAPYEGIPETPAALAGVGLQQVAQPPEPSDAPDFFIVQDDNGVTLGANSYCSIPYFTAYSQSRGRKLVNNCVTPPVPYTDEEMAVALILATDYMDGRWNYTGFRQQISQTTEWPRLDAYDSSTSYISGITDTLRRAQCEYAWIALTSGKDLNPIPERDDTGVAVQSKSSQVGPVSESTRYVLGGIFVNPTYPSADNILKTRGYVMSRSTLTRG